MKDKGHPTQELFLKKSQKPEQKCSQRYNTRKFPAIKEELIPCVGKFQYGITNKASPSCIIEIQRP